MFVNSTGQSTLGAALYVVVALTCLAASVIARTRMRSQSHAAQWLMIGLIFALLFLSRAFDVEESVRNALRDTMRADGLYPERRMFQRRLVVGSIILGTLIISGLIYRFRRLLKGGRELALGVAILATATMCGLIVLRMISLHQIDALLFGPFKINWIIDVGTSLFVTVSAGYYVRLLLRRR
jgi:uncharacterized membrane protein